MPILIGCSPRARMGSGLAIAQAAHAKPFLSTERRPIRDGRGFAAFRMIGLTFSAPDPPNIGCWLSLEHRPVIGGLSLSRIRFIRHLGGNYIDTEFGRMAPKYERHGAFVLWPLTKVQFGFTIVQSTWEFESDDLTSGLDGLLKGRRPLDKPSVSDNGVIEG
jgi:hypothetical protein